MYGTVLKLSYNAWTRINLIGLTTLFPLRNKFTCSVFSKSPVNVPHFDNPKKKKKFKNKIKQVYIYFREKKQRRPRKGAGR